MCNKTQKARIEMKFHWTARRKKRDEIRKDSPALEVQGEFERGRMSGCGP
jgi:hypothetical protein